MGKLCFLPSPASRTRPHPPDAASSSGNSVADNTTGANTIYIDESGYLAIYGYTLTAWGQTPAPTVTGDDSAVALSFYWGSDNQVNVRYTVGISARTGQHSIWLTTAGGKSNAGTYSVYDRTPSISSVSPSTWKAGASTAVTVSGIGFGTSPTVSFSDSYVSWTQSSATDTSITGTVTVGVNDPGGTATLTVTSNGYGSGFQSNGQSNKGSSAASVTPVTPTLSLSWPSPTSVTMSGSPAGGSFSFSQTNLNVGSYVGVRFQTGYSSTSNPNAIALTDPATSGGNTNPGALSTITVTYTAPNNQSRSQSLPISMSDVAEIEWVGADVVFTDGTFRLSVRASDHGELLQASVDQVDALARRETERQRGRVGRQSVNDDLLKKVTFVKATAVWMDGAKK